MKSTIFKETTVKSESQKIYTLYKCIIATTIKVFMFCESVWISNKRFLCCRSKGFAITGFLCLGYMIWVNYIYYMTGFWVYPVLKVLTFEQRIGFFIVCGVLGGCLYLIGDILNKAIWSGSHQSNGKSQKKNK